MAKKEAFRISQQWGGPQKMRERQRSCAVVPATWSPQVPKDGGTEREKQSERPKVVGRVNGKPHVRRDCEIAGGGCASETRGMRLSEM